MKWRATVVALALLTACSSSPNQRPKTKAHVTTITTPSSASPSRCRGADLEVGNVTQDGASGHLFFFVPLQNVSKQTCELAGYPKVTATPADSDLNAVHLGAYFPDPTGGEVAPGASGLVVLDANTHCAEDFPFSASATYTNIRLGLPGGGEVKLGDLAIKTCLLSVTQLGISTHAAPPDSAPQCQGADLRAGDDVQGAGMSHTIERIHLQNASTRPCWLFGLPARVTGRTGDGSVRDLPVGATYAPAPEPGEIGAGEFGEVLVETTSACDGMTLPRSQHVVYDDVSIEVPGGGTVSLGTREFDATCSIIVSALGVMTHSGA